MFILFHEDTEYRDIVFKKDCVYDFSDDKDFAMRWIKRGFKQVKKIGKKKALKDPRKISKIKE